MKIVPVYPFRAFSKTSFESMSKWFVGSSRSRKFAFDKISFNIATLALSPPLSEEICLNTSSFSNKNAPSIDLI